MIRKSLLVFLAVIPLCAQVKLTQGKDRISVDIDGKPFTEFFMGADAPKPYLHPLRTASGVIVSRHFPIEKVEGETVDHPHHRGLWFGHGDVNGIDFWMNEPPGKRANIIGSVVLNKVLQVTSGAKSGSLAALFDWVGPKKNTMLTELRTMTFYSEPRLRTVDFDITMTAVEKVRFADTKEGAFAIRVAAGLEAPGGRVPPNPPRTGRMIDSEGRESEANVWGKRAPWADVYGEVEGRKVGIAIMDHPSSDRYPTYWHCRAYGLCAANMWGLRDFTRDKTQDGSLTLEPGQKFHLRYRVIVHPDDPKTADVAGLYKIWAATK